MTAKDQNYDGVSQYFEHDYEEIRERGNLELQSIAYESTYTQPAQKLPTETVQEVKKETKKKKQTRCMPVLVTLLTVLVVAMAVVLVMLIFTG